MSYTPQINDYVQWMNHIEGWVYFKCNDYITIEQFVRPKDEENYHHCRLHQNERLLVLCYHNQWKDLSKIGYRKDKYSTEILKEKE